MRDNRFIKEDRSGLLKKSCTDNWLNWLAVEAHMFYLSLGKQ